MDAGPILGLSEVRPTFLVHLSTTEPREGETGHLGGGLMTPFRLDDEEDEDEDDDDFDEKDDDGDDEEEDDDEEEEEETWQVSPIDRILTSPDELPRLAGISSSAKLEIDLAGPRRSRLSP
jgi:hypothetical protein